MKTMITPCIAIANIVATDCTKIAILQPTGGPDLVELLAEKVKKKRIREKAVKRLMEKSPTETIEAQGLWIVETLKSAAESCVGLPGDTMVHKSQEWRREEWCLVDNRKWVVRRTR